MTGHAIPLSEDQVPVYWHLDPHDDALPQLSKEATEDASPVRQAALRQFSLARLVGYGVELGDAITLRRGVENGGAWDSTAVALADAVLAGLDHSVDEKRAYRLNLRGSALLRMSQMMDFEDSPARRAVYARASALFSRAGWTGLMAERVEIPTPDGILVAWRCRPDGEHFADVIMLGGIEGWAMDLLPLAMELAPRGIGCLLLDGPGQGESRLLHGTRLTDRWRASLTEVIEWLTLESGLPVGLLGNSMGGTFVAHLATAHPGVKAVCNNGGLFDPMRQSDRPSFFTKMAVMCGYPDIDLAAARQIWSKVAVTPDSLAFSMPYLIVHGAEDPMVTLSDVRSIYSMCASDDKQLHIFQGGDHCVYNRSADKLLLIADWFVDRFARG